MSSKLLAVVIVGGLCVAAAGGGAYLAVRQGAHAAPAPRAVDEPVVALAPAPAAGPSVGSETAAPDGTISTPSAAAAEPTTAPTGTGARAAAGTPRPGGGRTQASMSARRTSGSAVGAPQAVASPEPVPSAVAAPQAPSPFIPSRPTLENVPADTPPVVQATEPEPAFEELLVPADAVIGLQVERTISTETARIEDRVDARVTRDVRVAGQVAIPAGARARGTVTLVEPGGKFKERARLGVRFHTILLADGASIAIQAETIYREGASPTGESAAKIGGGAIGGAIIGAILGGRKGAAIGGSLGAGAGTATVAAGHANAATLAAGSNVTVRLSRPTTVTVERHD